MTPNSAGWTPVKWLPSLLWDAADVAVILLLAVETGAGASGLGTAAGGSSLEEHSDLSTSMTNLSLSISFPVCREYIIKEFKTVVSTKFKKNLPTSTRRSLCCDMVNLLVREIYTSHEGVTAKNYCWFCDLFVFYCLCYIFCSVQGVQKKHFVLGFFFPERYGKQLFFF